MMPVYYFHVVVGDRSYKDEDGASYFELGSAKAYARRLARELHSTGNFDDAVIYVFEGVRREVFSIAVKSVCKSSVG